MSKAICAYPCFFQWSADAKWLYVAGGNNIEPGRRTVAVPLAARQMFPEFPENGNAAAAWTKLPGVQVIERTGIVPGRDPSTYVFTKTEERRNLFRMRELSLSQDRGRAAVIGMNTGGVWFAGRVGAGHHCHAERGKLFGVPLHSEAGGTAEMMAVAASPSRPIALTCFLVIRTRAAPMTLAAARRQRPTIGGACRMGLGPFRDRGEPRQHR